MYPDFPVLTRALGVLLLLGPVLGPRPAQAETTFCTAITTAPTTITTPGIYCLTQDIATNLASGAAITIAANNVVLDLNGHRLANLAAGLGTEANGIFAVDRKNLTIKNGTVRGFRNGILLDDTSSSLDTSQGHLIEDLRADQNTAGGIEVQGRGNLIRDNQVVATGRSTAPGTPNSNGIVVLGPENRIVNNDVIDTFATSGGSSRRGIFLGGNHDNLVVNNRITNAEIGIFFNGDGKFRDNLTSGVATPFLGGTDAGNNN